MIPQRKKEKEKKKGKKKTLQLVYGPKFTSKLSCLDLHGQTKPLFQKFSAMKPKNVLR